ncbi:MAG: ATP-dependent DNA helicase, partial [Streptosporangiaceae bacterium]
LADRALAGEFEEVVSMGEPSWPALPDSMVRGIDGQSWYTRPGAIRYATRVQLSLEERLVARAQRETTARMTREDAGRELGADIDSLDRALRDRAQTGRAAETTGSGLRMDQAAALAYLLTSRRAAEVLVGPAGSGKTHTLATGARAWTNATGGKVIGLATAQAARNVLADAGVDLAENLAQFLGHLPGERGARGARDLEPGTLIVMDESSMISTADMADVIAYAAERGCKVIAAGDQEQLASVEGGGGMHLLASKLGYVQLAEAVRFEEDWERKASLGLRRGSQAALDAYWMQGRLTGALPEQAIEEAANWYLGWTAGGADTLLIAQAHELVRELSRRVRDELASLGKVDTSREVPIAFGARAGVGDIIIARKNDHAIEAGEEGRPLANGDILRVLEVADDGSLTVQRKVGRDPDTGEAQWSAGTFRHTDLEHTDLGYAVTGHSAQGLTVTNGIALVTGSETRNWFYTAMTRGAKLNQAVAFTTPRSVADTTGGTRQAPELARSDRMRREREGLPALPESSPGKPEPRDSRAVYSDVLEHAEAGESALETWERMLADADHLGRLAAMWDDLTGDARRESYRAAVRAALPAGYEDTDLDGGHATWLWRTLRHAEAAGMDVGRLVATAIAERPLTGARDVAAVIDARMRAKVDPAAPLAPKPWAERVPEVGDPERQQFLRQLAEAMDGRQERLGAHAAVARPGWALSALGDVPGDPTERLEWEHRAAAIAAYRERYAWEDETEPVGPEPVNSPEARAMWFAAYSAMSRTDEAGLDRLPDGSLWHMRSTYQAETAWAPAYAGDELRQVNMAAMRARAQIRQAADRAEAARQAGETEVAARHEAIAES